MSELDRTQFCLQCESYASEAAALKEDCIRLQQEINSLRMGPCQLPACEKVRGLCEEMAEMLDGINCDLIMVEKGSDPSAWADAANDRIKEALARYAAAKEDK